MLKYSVWWVLKFFNKLYMLTLPLSYLNPFISVLFFIIITLVFCSFVFRMKSNIFSKSLMVNISVQVLQHMFLYTSLQNHLKNYLKHINEILNSELKWILMNFFVFKIHNTLNPIIIFRILFWVSHFCNRLCSPHPSRKYFFLI